MDFRVFKELKGLMVLMVRCCWEEKVKKDRQATKESRAHQGHQDQRQAPYGYIHHGVEHSNSLSLGKFLFQGQVGEEGRQGLRGVYGERGGKGANLTTQCFGSEYLTIL